MKFFKRARKLFAVVSSILMLVQPILPVFPSLLHPVYAQEITASSEQPSPPPPEEISPAPTDQASPAPSAEITPTVETTPTKSPVPTETVEPTSSPTEQPSQQSSNEPPKETGPPSSETSTEDRTEQGQILDGISTTLTPEATPTQPDEEGELHAIVLQNIEAESLDLDNIDPSNSASLSTDKADYAPTDTAVITGTNFTPRETYTLTISSSDLPVTSLSVSVTADDNGSFVYAYQLDGIYRPHYKVDAKSNTTTLAETTFTDSPSGTTTLGNIACMAENPKSPKNLNCTANDVSLASVSNIVINDDGCKYPGDTVNFTANWSVHANATSRYNVGVWFATSGQSSAQTGPAGGCSVTSLPSSPAPFFDGGSQCGGVNSGTDGSISITMTAVCNPDENGLLQLPYCTSWQENDHDSCVTPTDAVPGTASKCNCQPGSTVPISVPKAAVEVKKILSPFDDSGLFNLQVNGITHKTDATNNDTTGNIGVNAGATTVGEIAGTGTALMNYSSSVSCVDKSNNNSITVTGSNPWTFTTTLDQSVLCTITNTRVNNASLTIIKDADPNSPQDFAFTATGTGLSNFSLDDDTDTTLMNTKTFTNLTAGTYSISETAVTGWAQTSATCSDGSPVTAINISEGENVTCTFTNTKMGKIITEKQTNPADSNQSFTFSPSWGSTFQLSDNQTYDSGYLLPGIYSVTETVPNDWKTPNINCSNGDTDASFNLQTGEVVTCTFTNTQYGSISGFKFEDSNGDGQYQAGTEGIISWSFFIDTNYNGVYDSGVDAYTSTTGIPATYHFTGLNPGQTYRICEVPNTNYYPTNPVSGCKEVVAQAGIDVTQNFGNALKGTLVVKKVMVGGTDTFTFSGDVSGTINSDAGTLQTSNVLPGTYVATESAQTGWDLTSILCDDTNSLGNTSNRTASFVVDPGETVTCTFTNTKRGSIGGYKYEDTDGDGTFDTGEEKLDGWTIKLMNETGNGELASTTTDVNGLYGFTYIAPGNYQVCEINQSNWSNTDPGFGLNSPACKEVTVTSGQESTIDFGNFQCALISGTKWRDLNGNGVWDTGEQTLANWSIQTKGAESHTTTTDANGQYSFTVCTGGNYTVTEEFPDSSWYQTFPGGASPNHQINVTSGGSYSNKNFGNAQYATIYGYKYRDNDGNGVLDSNDLTDTLAGWIFDLYDGATGTWLDNYTTLADGYYEFTGLLVNQTYYVLEQLQPGWTQTYGPMPTPTPISLESGEEKEVDFANFQHVSVTVCKHSDPDGDINSTEGRTIIPGWSVSLIKNGDTAHKDTKTTGDNGCAQWLHLEPGSYTVTEELQTGWTNLTPTTHDFGIVQSGSENYFDFINTELGSITITKQTDPNDSLEPFTFHLTGRAADSSILTDGQSDTYSGLLPGNYTITETIPEGWSSAVSVLCDRASYGHPTTLTLAAGQDISCTYTNTQLGQIIVEKQTNPKGSAQSFQFNANYDNDGFSLKDGQMNNSGYLNPGLYSVNENLPDGWIQTSAICEGETWPGGINLEPGETVSCAFTNTQLGSIVGRKYEDLDGNGVRGGSEPYLDGWTVHLFDAAWTEISQMQTGDDTTAVGLVEQGQYKFTNLNPATYFVCEDIQSGWKQSQPSSGELRNGTYCRTVTVNAGQSVTEQHFGNIQLGIIQSRKYEDANGDSVRTDDESWLDGWSIRLYRQGEGWELVDSKITGHTGTSGQYRFENLTFGTYYVCEVNQLGWVETDPSTSEGYANQSGATDEAGRCRRFIVDSSGDESIGEKHFGNQGRGTITIHKDVDTDGDGVTDVFGDSSWTWDIDGNGNYPMGSTQEVATGTYQIAENQMGNYHFVSLVCNDVIQESETPLLTIKPGDQISCTFTNARNTGTIIIDKVTNPSNSLEEFTINLNQGLANDPSLIHSSVLLDQDNPDTYTVITGEYWLEELVKTGWDLTEASCIVNNNSENTFDPRADGFVVNAEDTISCTFTNTQRGTVIIHKFNDINRNETYDEDDELLPEWTMNLTSEGTVQQTTNIDGQAIFEYQLPGTYTFSEVLKPGWEQTGIYCREKVRELQMDDTADTVADITNDTTSDNQFTLNPGETKRCYIGNHQLNPILTITKTNNASGVKNPGDSVTFTITVTATQSAAFNVFVTDLPSNGFTYRTNSWTANSTARGDLKALGITVQPAYASPGIWTLGDMEMDETVTLTYIADISTDQKPGVYKDLAWGYGCRFETNCEVGDVNSVLSNAMNPGFVDDNFVGTQVEISKDQQSGATLNPTVGEVLGAATELPATGSNELWIKLAALFFLVGLGFIAAGHYSRRYYV